MACCYVAEFESFQELAKEFPNSTFTGSDITNVFADFMANAPPNCTFLEADTAKGLPFDDNTFDFVFERANMTCFSNAVWPAVLRELIRVTKPGGYIELVEGCLPKNAGPALTQHVDWCTYHSPC
ncbi:hypothetical protein BC938DRAFT_479985 [Jimgerdemannia flammicorona]|uniref:Methyltransferase domain-containing protein n=1 Tax=Jimgerdemannia flammicorona TaxID=994334 RepID=A0A433QJN7_9FUNG|nr:hypothetical protein BC938DRAFT_479985 [Jimgerdemannia flammicorona]